ncbi:hypothetical protein SAMN03159407_1197 [Rhizobium sp. NFR12]|nr:hypothetical protein SAMN03159407_1197 [Rhizobium sp. NFR12]
MRTLVTGGRNPNFLAPRSDLQLVSALHSHKACIKCRCVLLEHEKLPSSNRGSLCESRICTDALIISKSVLGAIQAYRRRVILSSCPTVSHFVDRDVYTRECVVHLSIKKVVGLLYWSSIKKRFQRLRRTSIIALPSIEVRQCPFIAAENVLQPVQAVAHVIFIVLKLRVHSTICTKSVRTYCERHELAMSRFLSCISFFHRENGPSCSSNRSHTGEERLKVRDDVSPRVAAGLIFHKPRLTKKDRGYKRTRCDDRDKTQPSPFSEIHPSAPLSVRRRTTWHGDQEVGSRSVDDEGGCKTELLRTAYRSSQQIGGIC